MATPKCKGVGGVTLVLFMFVCGSLTSFLPQEFSGSPRSFPGIFQPSLRLERDGQNTCDSGAEAGVCYDALNCLKVSGMFGANCPDKQGVCCLFYRQCGQQSSQEVSYFQNREEEAGSGCNYRVVKRSPRYCTMRVNLEQLELPTDCQTSLSIEGVSKGQNIGKLRFPERNSTDKICSTEAGVECNADKICSTEAGVEYAFETKNLDEVRVNVESTGGITGKWKIRVTQVLCGDEVNVANVHDSHIPAIWPPPLPTHPPPQNPRPTTQTTQTTQTTTTKTATCWWDCDRKTTPATPTVIPTTPSRPSRFSQCGVRGPNSRSLDIRERNAPDGESTPFIEDLEYGNPSRNDSIFEDVLQTIKDDPFNAFIPGLSGRITFGKPSGKREYPWQVGMKVRGRFHCGASLISDQHVLTAAHCVTKYRSSPRTLYLTLGDWDLSTPNEQDNVVPIVERVTVHPQYSRTTLRNDLAVLKLTKKVRFADNIRPICLAPAGFDATNKIAIVTGWGRDENNRLVSQLHELASEVTTNAYCARQWEVNGAPSGFITNDMMCMSPIGGDSCNGDSGGPSVTEIGGIQYQVGIVSFGSGSCVDETLPGVYTKVTKYRDWIMQQMN